MKSGKTLWDELCVHYYKVVDGLEEIQKIWDSLKGKIDKDEFNSENLLLKRQHEDALKWREGCALYFQTFSKLPVSPGLPKPEHYLEYYKTHNPI